MMNMSLPPVPTVSPMLNTPQVQGAPSPTQGTIPLSPATGAPQTLPPQFNLPPFNLLMNPTLSGSVSGSVLPRFSTPTVSSFSIPVMPQPQPPQLATEGLPAPLPPLASNAFLEALQSLPVLQPPPPSEPKKGRRRRGLFGKLFSGIGKLFSGIPNLLRTFQKFIPKIPGVGQ